MKSLIPRLFRGSSFRAALFRGSFWGIFSFAGSSVIRLTGSLVLTRLLVPEAFGLMALVNSTMTGLQMLTDVGLRGAIIQNERGEEPAFLNTAWTIQVVRGFALWLAAVAIAWPIAIGFQEPELVPLLAVAGIMLTIRGFASMMVFVHQRKLELKRPALLDLVAQCIGFLTMILWAWIHPTVYALAAGLVVTAASRTIGSFLVLRRHQHKFEMERSAASTLFHFGKWIFLSTAISFGVGQLDLYVVAALSDVATLGLYSIALTLAGFPGSLVSFFMQRVMFPAYASAYRDGGGARLREHMKKASIVIYAGLVPVYIALFVLGDWIVTFLYDPRYEGAGMMLSIHACGALGAMFTKSASAGLLATGNSRSHATLEAVRLAMLVCSITIGLLLGDFITFLIALAISRWLEHIPAAVMLRQAGIWNPAIDLTAITLAGGILIILIV